MIEHNSSIVLLREARKCGNCLFIAIFFPWPRQYSSRYFANMSPNADIQISAISALKMFADSRYADIEKKCRYADIADADINIGTPLLKTRLCATFLKYWDQYNWRGTVVCIFWTPGVSGTPSVLVITFWSHTLQLSPVISVLYMLLPHMVYIARWVYMVSKVMSDSKGELPWDPSMW